MFTVKLYRNSKFESYTCSRIDVKCRRKGKPHPIIELVTDQGKWFIKSDEVLQALVYAGEGEARILFCLTAP